MKTRLSLASAFVISGLLSVAACHITPEHRPTDVPVPAQWSEGTHAASEPPEKWWKEFGDAELDSLVERAVVANHDLAIARARVREARGLRDIAAGARLPEVDGVAGASRSRISANTPQGAGTGVATLYNVGFDATWEVDLFGSNRAALAASEAGLEAAQEGARDALVSLLGEVARNYTELRGAQRQIELTRANADAQRHTLDLTRSRFTAGLSTQLDVARAQTLLSNTDALVPSLQTRVESAIHRISVLLGEPPATLTAELQESKPVPTAQGAVAELASGVPSDLLRRRPDVRRAERELAQAASLTDQATADLYPKLTLGASLGLQSSDLGDLWKGSSKAWSVGGSLFAPIFQGDRLRAAVRVQNARQDQALEHYRQTVIGALSEVEDALTAVAHERDRHRSLTDAVASSQKALDLASDLQLRGLIDFFEVLDAQRSQLLAESLLAASDTDLTSQTVALYKALGGGWESMAVERDPSAEPSIEPAAEPAAEPTPASGPGR